MWSRLIVALGAGVQYGTRIDTLTGAPRRRTGEQDAHSCEMMLRLDEPRGGTAVFGSCPVGDETRVMVTLFLYGDGAAETAAAEQPKWAAWLDALPAGEKAAT